MSTEAELTDYEKALRICGVMPRFFLGQEVKTKIGNGIIVGLKMHWNGLYLEPERTIAQVWFGTSNDCTKWISQDFQIKMIEPLNVA